MLCKPTAFHDFGCLSPHFVGAKSVCMLYTLVGNGAVYAGVCNEWSEEHANKNYIKDFLASSRA